MKKATVKNLFKAIAFVTPFCLSMGGYFLEGQEPFLNAAFNSIGMYLMNYGDTPPNLLLEAARWTAPLATASGLLFLFISLRTRIRNTLKYMKGESIAVYGDGADLEDILAQLGSRGIRGEGTGLVRADSYIFMFGDERVSYDLYRRNLEELQGKQVYIRSASLRPQAAICENLHFFQYEEAKARAYWKQQMEPDFFHQLKKRDYRLEIAVIGGGRMGQELLLEALQNNIFHPDQKISYHLFGFEEKFEACYPGLKQVEDPVIFHEEPWYQAVECLKRADRILVCDQENEVELLGELLLLIPEKRIDLFSREGRLLDRMFPGDNIFIHDAKIEGGKIENILQERLFEKAKDLNLDYAVLYGGVSKDPETREREWKKLNTFTKYSNVSSADYHEVRKKMLCCLTGSDRTDEEAYGPYLEFFSELEHIRWCRYHFLNNWKYGIPENGKAKDPVRRIHRSLIPYKELSEEEKEKDRETVRCLFSWNEI